MARARALNLKPELHERELHRHNYTLGQRIRLGDSRKVNKQFRRVTLLPLLELDNSPDTSLQAFQILRIHT